MQRYLFFITAHFSGGIEVNVDETIHLLDFQLFHVRFGVFFISPLEDLNGVFSVKGR